MSTQASNTLTRREALDANGAADRGPKGTALAIDLWNAEVRVESAVDRARKVYKRSMEARVGLALGVIALVASILRRAKAQDRS
jgi:hypothetical protein